MLPCPRCASACGEGHRYCVVCGESLPPPSDVPEVDPIVGRSLPGGYLITRLLGVGGMGRVYLAEQMRLGRNVAVKVMHKEFAGDDLAAARFLNEARTASRLSHPNSVAIFDFGRTEDGLAYIVMEQVRGRDLSRVAEKEGPLPLRRVVAIMRQILAALDEAHALGIVHRDLKPDNVVIETLRSGHDGVKVVDFGLAKVIESAALAPGAMLSRPGLVCGTPEYMSPEQARGDALDGRSDLYAAGVVLFELLTGRPPFSAETPTATLVQHLMTPPPDPRDVAPDRAIPAVFALLTDRALAKAARDRFQTAAEFSDDLLRALVETETQRFSDSPPSTGIRCMRCGKLSALGQKFCGDCGTSMPATEGGRAAAGAASVSPRSSRTGAASSYTRTRETAAQASRLPLLGRDGAIAWLEGRREDAGVMPASAHLVGEAGTGKTRLLREMLARWSSRGDFVVAVGVDPAWAKIADGAVRAAIGALAGSDAVSPEAWKSATPLAEKGLTAIFGPSPPAFASPDERRRAVAEALRWALVTASERRAGGRVVLAVDDIDFIDGASRNAVADVLAAPPPAAVLVLVTYAPAARPVLDTVGAEAFHLETLPYEAFGHLLPRPLLPSGDAASPLHVEHLLAWAEETLDAPPAGLGELLARRIDLLPLDARNLLHALAVWGDDARPDVLQCLVPGLDDVRAGLGALERASLVAVDALAVRTTHGIVRSVALSTIPRGRRQELFERAAALRPDAPIEVRAKDAMHAGSAFEALALLDTVASHRAAHGDGAGCVSALRHAVDVARRELHRGEIDDPVDAYLVFARKLATALADLERWADAEGVLGEALGAAPPASEHRAHLLGTLAHVAHARRRDEEAARYIDEALRAARASDARELLPVLERLEKTIAVA